MNEEKFHIIAFDVPYPPNYGGIVDVFYKLKHLCEAGGKIIYHCFYYQGHNPPSNLLEQYCAEIHYYPRKKKIWKLLFSNLPYVVSSRDDKTLLKRLLADDFPIFFDGIQTCFFLDHPALKNRKRLFRANNIEHDYYAGLVQWETSWLKKIYLKTEAKRLARFEKKLSGVDAILSVAKMDIPHFEHYAPTFHIPPFFNSHNSVRINQDLSQHHVLFQGNLGVKENEHAALFIAQKIAPLTQHKIIIAGKSPSTRLKAVIDTSTNVELMGNLELEVMNNLIKHSKVNLLLTFQQTGIKLKLLHALESGQHIIINQQMDDSGIFATMCHVQNKPEAIAKQIDELMDTPFTQADKDMRDAKFDLYYNNTRNAQRILELIQKK